MAVLNRKMFSRGGFAHRGTGITTGLTPVQKFAPGGEVTGTGALLELDPNAVNEGPEPAGKYFLLRLKQETFLKFLQKNKAYYKT
jgi:hypothetical protein